MVSKASNQEKLVKAEDVARLQESIEHHLKYSIGKRPCEASKSNIFNAVALAVREYAIDGLFKTSAKYEKADAKRIYYLSVEYLVGRLLENNLRNLGLYDALKQIKIEGLNLEEILDCEYDPALGNGGLGRLAACFMDSLATLNIPGFGYGINYKFGLFKQSFDNGYQIESADSWFEGFSPWQIVRYERASQVPFGGNLNENGLWVNQEYLMGIPYDMPIIGYGGDTVNYLRLFSARTSNELDIKTFNDGGYIKAVEQKIKSETISKVLYPSDNVEAGKKLRLLQQYFFISCAIQDIIRRFLELHEDLRFFPEKIAIQLNDTHPVLAIPELMRILMDEHGFEWDKAWDITTRTISFTNHTLLPEALEKWPVDILSEVLPRHLDIIYKINYNFLEGVKAAYPEDDKRLEAMSLIEEGKTRKIRMAYLAIVGSHSVNGVAALHTELIKSKLVPLFNEYYPGKINNKTNGITPRRWLLSANNELATAISERIGDSWITNLDKLRDLEKYSEDKSFVNDFYKIKSLNKEKLARIIFDKTEIIINPDSIFDVQIKRIHEYKRQLLNALHIIHLYHGIKNGQITLPYPKTYIFAGKAAPSYGYAKLIIKLINNIAKAINTDPKVKEQMRVVFIPDYKVSLAERIFPAADISEQISTAGFEASGTGNMKFALNGALTIGTLDGANIEIREEVGAENFYLFGHTAEEIEQMRIDGSYNPQSFYDENPVVRRIMNSLSSNDFCKDEIGLIFKPIYDKTLSSDYFFVLADLEDYIKTQERINKDYLEKASWGKKAILNIARIGKFSSDRTIKEYASEIWGVKSIPSK